MLQKVTFMWHNSTKIGSLMTSCCAWTDTQLDMKSLDAISTTERNATHSLKPSRNKPKLLLIKKWFWMGTNPPTSVNSRSHCKHKAGLFCALREEHCSANHTLYAWIVSGSFSYWSTRCLHSHVKPLKPRPCTCESLTLDCWLDFSTARWLQPRTPEIVMRWSERRQ